jgi:hypothetical protein
MKIDTTIRHSMLSNGIVVISQSFTVPGTTAECLEQLEAMTDDYARSNRGHVDALNFQLDALSLKLVK